MNRNQLLKMARQAGFKGKGLAELLAWSDAEGVEFQDASGKSVDIESAWGQKAILTMEEGDTLGRLEVHGAESDDEKMDEMEDDEEDEKILQQRAAFKLERQRQKDNVRHITKVARQIHEGNKAPSIRSHRQKMVKRYTENVRNGGSVYIPGEGRKRPVFQDGESAEFLGAFIRFHTLKAVGYAEQENDLAIIGKALGTTDNSLGGGLIPHEFRAELIELKEEYGAARRVFGVIPMSRDTLEWPRLGDDVVPTWQGENQQESGQDKPTTDNVLLTARKMLALSYISSELMNDSAISVADMWTRSFARGTGLKEDNAAFLGDGTSTYGGVTGVRSSLGAAGKVTLTGAAFSAVTLPEIVEGIGKLPGYALQARPTWVMNSAVWYGTLSRLQAAAGGNTSADLAQGNRPMFQGFPVEFSQACPATDPGASTVFMFLGAFPLAGKFGEVSGSNEVATSDQFKFDQDQITIRGRERVAINVHDAGDDSTAGPVIGFQLAS